MAAIVRTTTETVSRRRKWRRAQKNRDAPGGTHRKILLQVLLKPPEITARLIRLPLADSSIVTRNSIRMNTTSKIPPEFPIHARYGLILESNPDPEGIAREFDEQCTPKYIRMIALYIGQSPLSEYPANYRWIGQLHIWI
jgi:hypothetical protein